MPTPLSESCCSWWTNRLTRARPKEYDIAVRAMGRPESFDPRTDPVVRVSAGTSPRTSCVRSGVPGRACRGAPAHQDAGRRRLSTGTLGLGISTALGMALAAKIQGRSHRCFVLCGDGEIQEGQAWEGALFGNKYRLDNVVGAADVYPVPPSMPRRSG